MMDMRAQKLLFLVILAMTCSFAWVGQSEAQCHNNGYMKSIRHGINGVPVGYYMAPSPYYRVEHNYNRGNNYYGGNRCHRKKHHRYSNNFYSQPYHSGYYGGNSFRGSLQFGF